MSTLRYAPALFLCLTTCRVDPKREPVSLHAKPTRSAESRRPEIFPRVLEEPQPVVDAILVQPQISECLARAPGIERSDFSMDLGGRISETGRVSEARASGVDLASARCFETALEDLLLLPSAGGVFRINLSRRARGAGPGVIVDPEDRKKFE